MEHKTEILGIIWTVIIVTLLVFAVFMLGGCDHDVIKPEDKIEMGELTDPPYGYAECVMRGNPQCR